jgi:Tfp pilus assembly protein FimV
MEHLGVVAAGIGRNPRAYAGPAALLAAATLAIGLLQAHLRSHQAAPPAPAAPRVVHAKHQPKTRALYVVRAGDTLDAIAARTGVSLGHLRVLNPTVSPTALFIGEKIHLR